MAANGHTNSNKSSKTRHSPSLRKPPRLSFPSALNASDTEADVDDVLIINWPTGLTTALQGPDASKDDDGLASLSALQELRETRKRWHSGVDATGAMRRIQSDEKVESTVLEVASPRLELEVARWKLRHALHSEMLELKDEVIRCKEPLIRQGREVQAIEVRAWVMQALSETGKSADAVREYLEVLED